MDKVQQIVAKIEKRAEFMRSVCKHSEANELVGLLSFIRHLPEEPVCEELKVEGALEAVRIAREELSHSEVTKTCPRYDQEAVSDDLEDEIKRFWKNRCDAFSEEDKICECARHFADWQKVKMIEKAYEWIRCNWRKYVWKDGDEIVHFGHWEKPFRKAMEE